MGNGNIPKEMNDLWCTPLSELSLMGRGPCTRADRSVCIEPLSIAAVSWRKQRYEGTTYDPKDVIVSEHVPQQHILAKHASLFITHCGLNSALEGLVAACPMIGIPLANDQYGVAERLKFHGVGLSIKKKKLGTTSLVQMVGKVINDQQGQKKLREMSAAIKQKYTPADAAKRMFEILKRARNEA